MREVAHSRNLLSGFVTTLKRLFESVMGTLFCLLLYVSSQYLPGFYLGGCVGGRGDQVKNVSLIQLNM